MCDKYRNATLKIKEKPEITYDIIPLPEKYFSVRVFTGKTTFAGKDL